MILATQPGGSRASLLQHWLDGTTDRWEGTIERVMKFNTPSSLPAHVDDFDSLSHAPTRRNIGLDC